MHTAFHHHMGSGGFGEGEGGVNQGFAFSGGERGPVVVLLEVKTNHDKVMDGATWGGGYGNKNQFFSFCNNHADVLCNEQPKLGC